MKPSKKCKAAGLAGLAELVEITGMKYRTLLHWAKNTPERFDVLLAGAVASKPKSYPPETAPKDQQIMADFGWSWLQPAIWCSVTEKWVAAELNHCEESGKWYETEWYDESELRGWMPYPQASKSDSAEEHF